MAWAYAAAVLQAVIVGFSYLFIKIGLESAGVWDLLAWRYLAAFLAAGAAALFRQRRMRMSRRDLLTVIALGLLFPVLFFALQTLGLQYMDSAQAGIIQSCVPVFTLILAGLLIGERTTAAQKLFMALAVGGVAFISVMGGMADGSFSWGGTAMMVTAMLSLALYFVLARNMVRRLSVFDVSFAVTAAGCAVFCSICFGVRAAAGTLDSVFEPLRHPAFLAAALYLGIPSSLLTALLANYSLTRIDASQMSVFNNLSTVIAIGAGALILQETIHWFDAAGAVMIIAGVIGTSWSGRDASGAAGQAGPNRGQGTGRQQR